MYRVKNMYDPASPNEAAPPPPSAPPLRLGPSSVLQPPLSRRGTGPGLILVLPSTNAVSPRPSGSGPGSQQPLDPAPPQKWAEEGFAVVAITLPANEMELTGDDATAADAMNLIRQAADALKAHASVDTKDRFGLLVYEEAIVLSLLTDAERLRQDGIVGIVTFSGAAPPDVVTSLPVLAHTSAATTANPSEANTSNSSIRVHSYPDTAPHFVLPSSATYSNAAAGLAHTRSLVFLRKHLGGPTFDLEAIWEEHCYWEFKGRSVAKTMATMVVRTPC